MPTKISELPVAGALGGTETIPLVQAGATVKGTLNALAAWLVSSAQSTVVTLAAGQTLTNKTITGSTNTVYASAGPDGSSFGFRNKIIGGDFTTNPWQRGTSFTAAVSGAYTADRWLQSTLSDAVVNVLKTADAPTSVAAGIYTAHCLHVDVTTSDASIAAGQYHLVDCFLEGLNVASFGFGQAGTRNVTLSFWHKHTKTGTYCVAFQNGAGNRSYVAEYTQGVTDTWELATVTLAVDTSGTWLYDTGIGLRIRFAVAAGSTYQTTANTWTATGGCATANQVNALDNTANNFKIALVQLEAGSVATPFETRPIGLELALCQRYYYQDFPAVASHPFASGIIYATTVALYSYQFPVTMRAAPSFSVSSLTDFQAVGAAVGFVSSGITVVASTSSATRIDVTISGATAGQGSVMQAVNTNAKLMFNAEL